MEELLNGSGSNRSMFSQLPPGFPSLSIFFKHFTISFFKRLINENLASHHPTSLVPQNYLQPEIFLAAMAAAVNARDSKNYSTEGNVFSFFLSFF